MTKHILTSAEMLALNAGQLEFGSKEARAIALVLARIATPLDFTGRRGRFATDQLSWQKVVGELCSIVKLEQLAAILEWLEDEGYIEMDRRHVFTPNGVVSIIDTTTLALRCLGEDDACARTPQSRCSGSGRDEGAHRIGGDLSREPQGESATNEQEAA